MSEQTESRTEQRHQAIVALGTNLGDRSAHLARALELLRTSQGISSVTPSPIYETAPVGVEDQPAFLNMVAGVTTTLTPEELMIHLLDTEQQMGRIRTTRWGPRIIDLDLLFYENETRHAPSLILPHPRWRERSFVTVPLQDLLALPDFRRPVWSPVRERLAEIPPDPEIKRVHG